MLMVLPVDRIRRYLERGSYSDAQRRIGEALPTHPTSPELHDLLLELVARQPDLKVWAESLLGQIQDDTGKVSATLARLRGEAPPSPANPLPAVDDAVIRAPERVLEVALDGTANQPEVSRKPAAEVVAEQPRDGPSPDAPSQEPRPTTPDPRPAPTPRPTSHPETRSYYQRGREEMESDQPNLKAAIHWFELVPDTDPDSATARTQVDVLRNRQIPFALRERIRITEWKSAINSKVERRVDVVVKEITTLSREIREAGAPVPEGMVERLVAAQELLDKWEGTHSLVGAIAKGNYREAHVFLTQVVATGPFEPASRHRADLEAVIRAEAELRRIISRANPPTDELQAAIEAYAGQVSNLSPDDIQRGNQVATLETTAQRKLEDLIQQRFEHAKEEYDASVRRVWTLRNVIERLEAATDILEREVIRLDPNHADALTLQRKVKSRLEAATTLDRDIEDFPKTGDTTYTTAMVDGIVQGLAQLVQEDLDKLNDAVAFRSRVVEYCVERGEAFVTGATGGDRTRQIAAAEAWLVRAERAGRAFAATGSLPPEVGGLQRQIVARRRREPVEVFLRTYGRALAVGASIVASAIVVLMVFPTTRNAAIETYSAVCDDGWPACPKFLMPITEKNPNVPNCDFSALTNISVCDTNTSPFRTFWRKNPLLGEPIMPARFHDGTYIQDFVGGRISLNQGNPERPVQMSNIGDMRIGEVEDAAPYRQRASGQGECFVNEHNMHLTICGFYQNNGAQDYFGFPISEPYKVGGWTVQWFQRARIEANEAGDVRIAPVTCEFLEDKRRRQRVNCPVAR